MASAVSDLDEHVLRRVQSTGDLDIETSTRPSRFRISDSYGRSESQTPGSLRTPHTEEPSMSLHSANIASTPITVPEAAQHRTSSPHTSWDIPNRVVLAGQAEPNMAAEPHGMAPTPTSEPLTLADRLMAFLGYTGDNAKTRRELFSLLWNLAFALAQFIIIITLLAYSAHHESPTKPGLSEWAACERPLGVWDSIWLVRVALGCLLSTWGWHRERTLRLIQARRQNAENAEEGRTDRPSSGLPVSRPITVNRPTLPRNSRPSIGPITGQTGDSSNADPSTELKHSHLFSRLSLLTSFISLAWFLTAHILEYTSVNDCRFSSPHLWWLTFGILCILYVTILEIFLLGLLVFILGPVIYLFWNIFLLCLGRHPIQNPHYIKPEIGKLPKSVVDQIPLVLYIPPPPDDEPSGSKTKDPAAVSSPTHSYPPKPPARDKRPKRRFAFMRGMSSLKDKSKSSGSASSLGAKGSAKERAQAGVAAVTMTWEDHWEAGEYPFVRLEGNRAVCAICLLDFEEPKKTGGDSEAEAKGEERHGTVDVTTIPELPMQGDATETAGAQEVEEVQVEEVTDVDREQLRLDDAGEGPQPLRLLGCGHVFHKTCVDPWLTDVSGRCPVCQRPVEISEATAKKDKGSRRTS